MSETDAIDALRELGLPNYEARVFVALQRLGGGTAADVSEVSEVPRSQVYGAADDLAERGLVELVESSPKRYRPVSLEAAREHLRERVDRQEQRAFRNLEAIREEGAERSTVDVATLRGRTPVDQRVEELLGRADDLVIYLVKAPRHVTDPIAATLRERGEAGADVTVATTHPSVADRFAGDPLRVLVDDREDVETYTGRTLLVDEATVLMSVVDDVDDPMDETALWTDGSRIGAILGRFVHAGMSAAFDEE
ncbi:TrmB family transcriptional regulator [Halobacteriales archaeon QS_8_69_26]|nr:MAG: TrmB family transcriptional regulator [Halobacteriales archaeon QS_8_69_26]